MRCMRRLWRRKRCARLLGCRRGGWLLDRALLPRKIAAPARPGMRAWTKRKTAATGSRVLREKTMVQSFAGRATFCWRYEQTHHWGGHGSSARAILAASGVEDRKSVV